MTGDDGDVTELLLRWNAGDKQALDNLTPLLYDDLRRLARGVLAREDSGHTLAATALVHEVYLRLVDQRRVRWENRVHFFGAAAHIMRRVLVDHARAKRAAKRGGDAIRIPIDDARLNEELINDLGRSTAVSVESLSEEILALDLALDKLGGLDSRKSRIVEMKFFGGMTNQEMAFALGVSDATVERDWKMARAWLINAIAGH